MGIPRFSHKKGWFGVRILVSFLSVAIAFGALGAQKAVPYLSALPPISSALYFAVASESPGSVYEFNMLTKDISVLYTRPHGQLYSFTFHPGIPEKLYYVNANDTKIFRVLWLQDHWSEEEVIYQHTTYVRDIAFGPEPVTGTPAPGGPPLRLFFSEATGASGGKIYYLDGRNRPVLFYEVRMWWAGDFVFDENGVLYLSSGNRTPAKLYKVERGTVYTLYQHPEPIKGFVVRGGKIYFANWRGSIYVLDLATGELQESLKDPGIRWLSDVNFRD